MKGIIADAKTGHVVPVDDFEPPPVTPPELEETGLDLARTAQQLDDLDQRLKSLEASK